jgi:membrane protein DedA with SNARE-associated domain
MEDLINTAVHFIAVHSAWTFPVMFITAFGESFVLLSLAFPGTTIMVAAGLLVPDGTIPLVPLISGAVFGAALGDAVSWWLGRRYGSVLTKYWPFAGHPNFLAAGKDLFRRYGFWSVFVGRFFGPFRAVIPVTAGLMQMPPRTFWIANILSALIWAPALILPGSLAVIGSRILGIPPQWRLPAAAGLIVFSVALLWIVRHLGGFEALYNLFGRPDNSKRQK